MRKMSVLEQSGVRVRQLHDRADRALSLFRETAEELKTVNAGLQAEAEECEKLSEQLALFAGGIRSSVRDNEKVREKILGIIGEETA